MEVAEKNAKEAVARQFGKNDDELNKILENNNLNEFELHVIGTLWEQLDDTSLESTGVRLAPITDTDSTSGLAPSL